MIEVFELQPPRGQEPATAPPEDAPDEEEPAFGALEEPPETETAETPTVGVRSRLPAP